MKTFGKEEPQGRPSGGSGPGSGEKGKEFSLEYGSLAREFFQIKELLRKSEADNKKAEECILVLKTVLQARGGSLAVLSNSYQPLHISREFENAFGGRARAEEALARTRQMAMEAEALGRAVTWELKPEDGLVESLTRLSIEPSGSASKRLGFMVLVERPIEPGRVEPRTAEEGKLVEAIHSLQYAYIADTPPGPLFKDMLDHLLELTGSRFGFVGRAMRAPDGKPYMKTHAISDISWNETTSAIFQKISSEGMEFRNLKTLFGHTLRTGEMVISNDPVNDKRAGGLPEGHPRLDSYMGVPFTLNGRLVGMAGLANRPGGYDERSAMELQPLFYTCAALIEAYENKERRRQAEQGLEQARKSAEKATAEKDKFVSLIAHDLKSPFTSIIAFLKLLGKGKVSLLDPANRPLFDSIIESSERATRMIDEVLSLSRLGMGGLKLSPRFIDARAAAASAISLLGHMAQGKEIRIQNDIPAGSRIHVDPALFSEVLANLLSNAIKFTARGGKAVFFIPEAQPTTIALRDNGVGIDMSMLPNIFRHDIKTSSEGTEGEKGTGMAMPLCREIMRAHHGDLYVESTRGQGSVFYARLPQKQPVVLVVDDEKVAREGIKRMLARADVEVAEAVNAADAMSRAVARPPDLICLDLRMPKEDGYNVIQSLKGSPDTKAIPILVVTSDKTSEAREKAIMLGADDFITKDFLDMELVPRVRKFLA